MARIKPGDQVVCRLYNPLTDEPHGDEPHGDEFVATVLDIEGEHYIVAKGGLPYHTPLRRKEIVRKL